MYKVEIGERGSLFNETIEVNEKDGSVVYQVPDHNGVAGAESRYDYKTVSKT